MSNIASTRRLQKLTAEHADAIRDARAITAKAEADGDRDLTADEAAQVNALADKLGNLSASIQTEKTLIEAARNAPAVADPNITVGSDRASERPWASFGEQLQAIASAGSPGGQHDPRLYAAASGASAGVGADGGFLIHKDFSSTIYEKGYAAAALAPLCDSVEISATSDGIEVPYIKETSRATGSRWGGVQVYRRAEAATVTAKNVALGLFELRLEDLMGLSYATGRLLQDAPALEQITSKAFGNEFAFVLDNEIFRGTGAGECLGYINSPALVSVSAETGQDADTVVAENVMKMWARGWKRQGAVWFINQEIEPQLQTMMIGTGTSGHLIYMPPGGISGNQYATLYGRPVVPIEQASAIGDLGDISLVNLSEYALIRKGGLQSDQSMHVRFIYDEMTFRFIMRVNGKPKWNAALTPFKGASTLSPFVSLAAR